MSRVYLCACVILIGAALHGCQATGPDETSKPPPPPAAPPKPVETAPPEERAPPAPPPAPAAAPAPQPAQSAPIDVKTAQTLLNKRGYKVGTPDGKMGPRTREGLRRFQTDQRLPATGNLDRETMDRLMTK